jgi:hypothetical protein
MMKLGIYEMERSLNLKQSSVIVSILASLWLLNHPYTGIWHDSILYTFMALNKLHPDVFAGDLFLKFGSQDNYTIFSSIYAAFIKFFGVYKSALMLTVCGQLLWVIAAVTLFRTFLKGKDLWIALAILFFVPGYYGSFNCFRYAEPFLTPRIFSEALCILSMASIFKKRYILSAVLFLVSFFLHPLITLYAGFIVYVYFVLVNPRVLLLSPIFIIAIILLGLFKIAPFSGILRVMTPEWYQIFKARFDFMFTTLWPLKDWAKIFFSLSIVASAYTVSEGVMRRLFLSSIIVACCGLLLNIIGGEILRNEFIMQLQAWRCLWIVQFISALGAAVLIINFLKLSDNRFLLCAFFALAWYSLSLGLISFAITLLFLYLSISAKRGDLPPLQIKHPMIFLVLIIYIIIPDIVPFIKMIIKSDFNATLLSQLADQALFNLFLPLVLSLAIFFFYYHWETKPSLKLVFLSFALLICSLAAWNRQSPWSKMLETSKESTAFLRDILPEKSTILWDCSPEIAWIGAGRKGYLSSYQGASVQLYPEAAFEFAKRVNIILPLLKEDPLKLKYGYRSEWQIDNKKFEANYSNVCKDADELDYIISTVNVSGKPIAHWHSPEPIVEIDFLDDDTFKETKYQDFYLYDCHRYK